MRFKKLATAALVTSALAMSSLSAHANVILKLSDGVTTQYSYSAGNVASFSGTVGSWLVSLSAGVSYAPDGVQGIDLIGSQKLNGLGSGTLTVSMVADGFHTPVGLNEFVSNFVGNGQGDGSFSVTNSLGLGSFTLPLDPTDFGTVSTVFSSGPLAFPQGGALNDTQVFTTDPFILGTSVRINAQAGKSTSFDSMVSVPEPATVGLLGLSLLGLAFSRRRTQAETAE